MPLTRNQRRKIARDRLKAKSSRIAKAELARQRDIVRTIQATNAITPTERNYYKGTISPCYNGSKSARASVSSGPPNQGKISLDKWAANL